MAHDGFPRGVDFYYSALTVPKIQGTKSVQVVHPGRLGGVAVTISVDRVVNSVKKSSSVVA